jgi:type VI secretion system protein ImpA
MSGSWVGQDLVQPIAAARPCGEDLEDTPLLASFDVFRVFGQGLPYDPQPEWDAIASRAAEALCRSKDLRLLAHLGAALLRTDGLGAFVETLTTASAWLEAYWRDTYPRIDEDAILRRNALNCFADQMAIVDGLRRAPLVTSRQHGTFSLRDVEIASGLLPGDGGAPAARSSARWGEGGDGRTDEARITAAFAATPRDDTRRLQECVARGLAALARIDGRMRDEAGPDAGPSFDPLSAQLVKIDRLLRAQLGTGGDGAGEAPPDGAAGTAADREPAHGAHGAVRSRQDAIRALEAVAEYFRQHEPSSPIPLLLDRATRLVSKDFLDVLADIAPEALAQARAAGGIRES